MTMKRLSCPNCKTVQPYRNSCYLCNAPLIPDERERREDRRILNELREQNDKPPLDIEKTDPAITGPDDVDSPPLDPVVFLLALALATAVIVAILGLLYVYVLGPYLPP